MKVLSIVIPAYNSEAFLDKCIPSFFSHEVLDKLDIIIVNDGSSDGTVEAAEKYCRMYPASIRLISQENKGHGGALNTGFEAAVGRYVRPVDSDDWVETQNLPELIRFLETCSSDVVLTHYRTIDISTGDIRNYICYPEEFEKPVSMDEVMRNWHGYFRNTTFHGIIYRTAFYHTRSLQLSEHVFYEDNEYATFPFCHAETVSALDLFLYDYRIGDISQSISLTNQIRRLGHLETVTRRMLQEYSRLPEGAGKQYTAMKTQGVLLSYLNLTLLAHPDRKAGRQLAAAFMDDCRSTPEIHKLLLRKYQVLTMLSRFHVTKPMWDRFLHSKFYNRLRGNHAFE